MAQVLRLQLAATSGGQPPVRAETVIYKGTSSAKTQAIAARFESHEREAAFYRTIQPSLSIATPQCWSVALLPDAEPWLLLEDLAPKADLAQPLTLRSALTLLGNLHRETFGKPLTKISFSSNINNLNGFIQSQDPAEIEQLLSRALPAGAALMPRLLTGFAAVEAELQHPGPVLCHGDYRWDNLSAADAGCVFDWGDYCSGPPAYDLGYFFATSTQDLNPTAATLILWIDHYLAAMNGPVIDARPALTRAGLIHDLQHLLPIIVWTPIMMLLTAAEVPSPQHTYWRTALTHCETLNALLSGF